MKEGECQLPAFTYILYPNDHGGGASDINGPGGPPWDFRRFVQDNDAALGLTVELISKSPCWKDTVIFVTEDDTQSGLDHVDGYRTVFLAIGPWVKREYVSKTLGTTHPRGRLQGDGRRRADGPQRHPQERGFAAQAAAGVPADGRAQPLIAQLAGRWRRVGTGPCIRRRSRRPSTRNRTPVTRA